MLIKSIHSKYGVTKTAPSLSQRRLLMRGVLSLLLTTNLAVSPTFANEVLASVMNADTVNSSTIDPLPLAAYYAPESVKSLGVSPNGQYVSYLKLTQVDADEASKVESSIRYALVIVRANDISGTPVYSMQPSTMQLSSAVWLTDTKLIISMSQELELGNLLNRPAAFKSVLIDIETKKVIHIPPKRAISRSDTETLLNQANAVSIIGQKPDNPDVYLVSWTDVKKGQQPIYELNVQSGNIRKVARQRESLSDHQADTDGDIRLATSYKRRVTSYYGKIKGELSWELLYKDKLDDKTGFEILGFHESNFNQLYVTAYEGQDRLGVYLFDMIEKKIISEVFTPRNGDVLDLFYANVDGRRKPVGVVYADSGVEVEYFDENADALIFQNFLSEMNNKIHPVIGNVEINVAAQSLDGNLMILDTSGIDHPGAYFVVNNKKDVQFLAYKMPTLKDAPRNPQTAVTYTARDGLKIEGMLVRPVGKVGPGPTVIMPHGGPWARDFLGYDNWSDMLASRGYTVFRPNYRGSTGYGQALWKAGDGEWGYKMQDDLDDAASFLVDQNIADANELILYGYSYGGYAAMVAPVRDSPPYICAISGAGVSNMATIRKETWEGGRGLRTMQYDAVDGLSPDKYAEKASIPLLILHGVNDIIVPAFQSTEYAKKLKKYGKDYEIEIIPHMAHSGYTWSYGAAQTYYSTLFKFLEEKCQPKNGN